MGLENEQGGAVEGGLAELRWSAGQHTWRSFLEGSRTMTFTAWKPKGHPVASGTLLVWYGVTCLPWCRSTMIVSWYPHTPLLGSILFLRFFFLTRTIFWSLYWIFYNSASSYIFYVLIFSGGGGPQAWGILAARPRIEPTPPALEGGGFFICNFIYLFVWQRWVLSSHGARVSRRGGVSCCAARL